MKWRSIFRNRGNSSSEAQSDLFDIYHQPTMAAAEGASGRRLGDWSIADAADLKTAPRLILGLLRTSSNLRRKFPHALTGEQYREWLLAGGAAAHGVSQANIANLAAALRANSGEQIRQHYLHAVELQARFPLALLPVGQKKFVKWLFDKGAINHGFSDEAILWFLHETAEQLARGIAETYLICPEWQKQFPSALSPSNQGKILKWLRTKFPKYRPFRTVNRLPERCFHSDQSGANILAHFCYPSGLQQAALSAKAALESVGILTSCRDVPAGVRTDLGHRTAWLGLEIFPVSLFAIAPVPHFAQCYRRAGLHPRDHVYRIASWYWELERVPAEWKELASLADEIWAPTPFVAAAMRATMPQPVFEMLPAVSAGPVERISRADLGLAKDDFLFFFMFDMCSEMERKNPLGLIRAFKLAFPGRDPGAALLIKTTRAGADPASWARLQSAAAREQNIILIDELVSRERAYGYVAECDCFVSLHRSEGFGLGLAEAMLLGKPVIATNYSGNLAFMNRDNSSLVDYTMISIAKSGSIYKADNRWADPSEEHAAALMQEMFCHRESALARAKRAQVELSAKLSLEAAGTRMKTRLQDIRRESDSGPCRSN